MAQWTDPSRTFLIQEVRSRKVIWDLRSPIANDASAKAAKLLAFQEIANVMNQTYPTGVLYTGEDIRSQWKNLKDTFVRKLRWVTEGKYSDDPLKEPTWKFYRMLSFLDYDHGKRRSCEHLHHEAPIFDMNSLQRDHGMDSVKNEINGPAYDVSNQSAASSEEQMLSLFAQPFNDKAPVQEAVPSSPSLPSVTTSTAPENILAKPASYTNGDEDEEPRRKRPYNRRHGMSNGSSQQQLDEYDHYGAYVAAQLRRIAEEQSRSSSMKVQKAVNDVLFQAQLDTVEGRST